MDLYKFNNSRILPSEYMPLHKQDTWELTLVLFGRGRRTLGDTVTSFAEGDLAFIPPHIPHTWKFDENHVDTDGKVAYLTLNFRTDLIDRCVSAFPELTERLERVKSLSTALSFDEATTTLLSDLMRKMSREEESELIPYFFRLLLLISKREKSARVVGRFADNDRTVERINKVKLFTSNNYARSITIDMIAEHVGMNRSSFCTFFKKATGQTYITYLNKLRVDRACYLLRQGKFNLTEVCYMVGFNDVPYFNRCFKNNRGMSPKEYADGVLTNREMLRDRKVFLDTTYEDKTQKQDVVAEQDATTTDANTTEEIDF